MMESKVTATTTTSGSSSSSTSSSKSNTNNQSSSHFFKYFKKKSSQQENAASSSPTSTHSNEGCTFNVGVSEDKNRKCRRTMEDAHTYIYNFCDRTDDGYFAVFDGHAGKGAAEWCSKKMHIILESAIKQISASNKTVCHALNTAFTKVDEQISDEGLSNSGTTAAVAVMRWENDTNSETKKEKRVLYVANVGDTRVILCRSGKALRLSYDHKGSDPYETKRIMNSGGIVVNNRVNGVLAVTRSLGDRYMKQLVSGSPYTTETDLSMQEDEFIIVACDGLWDVCSDQQAVELIRDIKDPKAASQALIDYALQHFSSDNLTCMVIRL